MLRIYSNESSLLVNHMKNILEANGISSQIKNETMQGIGIGELGMCWPELWIKEISKQAQAEILIKQALAKNEKIESDWRCENCNEKNEATFFICWNCNHSKHLEG